LNRYGIFGGTFNPPHIAHSIVAESVMQQLKLEKIIFIPSGNPPLKESINALHRLAMASLAFSGNPGFEVSDIEFENPEEKSYTVNTLKKMNDIYGKEKVKLYLIIGIDNLIDLPKWKEPEKLFDLSEVVVINRPNYSIEKSKTKFAEKVTYANVPFLEISSSAVREYVKEGRSIKYMVCDEVEEYIRKNNLYKV
jgi:nicotinate-nucleotide adenylyltransferase